MDRQKIESTVAGLAEGESIELAPAKKPLKISIRDRAHRDKQPEAAESLDLHVDD